MPNPHGNQPDIAFSIKGAKCLKFALTDYGRTNKTKIPDDHYEYSLSLSLSTSKISQLITVRLTTQLFEKRNAQLKLALAEIQVACSFFIQNFDELLPADPEGNINIPDPLLQWCNNITLGVARGMFVSRLEKTLYANAILPLVDINLLTPSNLEPKCEST